MKISVEGVSVNYHDIGTGDPVILLHGSGPGVTAEANWSRTMKSIVAMGYRAIAPDVVGFGASDKPVNFPYGAEGWAQHIEGFLTALGIQKAHFVGNSMGGRIALTLAVRAPERLASLTLMGVRDPVSGPVGNLMKVRDYDPSLENMRRLLTQFFVVDASLVTEELIRARYEASISSGAEESYKRMFSSPSANELPVTEGDLRSLSVRTLLLHGREDQVIPVECTYSLVGLIPNAVAVIATQCGHWVHVEQADLFESQLAAFLDRYNGA